MISTRGGFVGSEKERKHLKQYVERLKLTSGTILRGRAEQGERRKVCRANLEAGA